MSILEKVDVFGLAASIKRKFFPSRKCEWRGKTSYKTGCGRVFFDATESGDPTSDWISFCPFCGREMEEEK